MKSELKNFIQQVSHQLHSYLDKNVHTQELVGLHGIQILGLAEIAKNCKRLEHLYLALCEREGMGLDECLFVNQSEKMKTPIKLQSLSARQGPMQR